MFFGSPWSPVEARRDIPAAPASVFAVLADPRTYPDWLVGAQCVGAVDASFPSPGSSFHHSVGPSDQATVDDITEVIAVDPPHCLKLRVHVGPLRGVVELLVAETSAGSTIRFRELPAGPARFAMPLLRPMLHGRNAESLRRLEDRVLAGRPASS